MTTRFTGVIPALALLAVGTATAFAPSVAIAQVQNQTGSMAYPQSNPSGQIRIPAPTARDTGNMAFPASPGGVTEPAPMAADTGNMATPMGRGSISSRRGAMAPMHGDPANAMRPDVAPTPAQTATARALDSAPSATPVPYTDFMPPERAAVGRGKMMPMHKRAPIHHAVMRHAAKPASGAAAPAASAAPATAAPMAAAPAARTPATPAAPAPASGAAGANAPATAK